MNDIDTSADVMTDNPNNATLPLRMEDWWIMPEQLVNSMTDSVVHEQADNESTQYLVKVPSVRAIPKASVRFTLDGDVKTLLQQWECIVIETDQETVKVEMFDLTDETNPVEYAEIYWSEFNDYDKPLIEEGAVFYWSIGFIKKTWGQVRRFSETRLRRMPVIGKSKRKEIASKVERLNGICKPNE